MSSELKSNLHFMSREIEAMLSEKKSVFDGGGGGGYDDSMESRVAKLEEFVVDTRERLTKIETRLEHTSTKSDVQESANKIVIWVAATAITLGATGIVVMTFVLNNAAPRAPAAPAAPPQPIVIYAQPAPVASPPQAAPAKP